MTLRGANHGDDSNPLDAILADISDEIRDTQGADDVASEPEPVWHDDEHAEPSASSPTFADATFHSDSDTSLRADSDAMFPSDSDATLANEGYGGDASPPGEPDAVVLPGTRPVVEFAFHPHWVDADAVGTALGQLHPLVTILSGDHRLNARTEQLAATMGLKTRTAGDDTPRADLVVVFADLEDDAEPSPVLTPGTPHLMVSHSSRKRAAIWRLAPSTPPRV